MNTLDRVSTDTSYSTLRSDALDIGELDSILQPTAVRQIHANGWDYSKKIGEIIKPDAIAVGETHGDTPLGPLGRGGNFMLISTKDGSRSYFGAHFLRPAPLLPTPFGIARGSISAVGTNNGNGDEAGIGIAYKLPTPAGDLLFFINGRQDAATGGNLIDAMNGKAKGTITASVNFGVVYSVSDGVTKLLAVPTNGGSLAVGAALDGVGVDGWLGAGYRGSATFKDGQLQSINISGVTIPAAEIGGFLTNQVQNIRNSPPLIPNGGNTQIASMNDNIQLMFGQSPWDVGFSAIKKDARGATEIRNGTVDVRNHGNNVTAITEPVYELGVKYGVIAPGQRITNNQKAGQVVDQVLQLAIAKDKANQAGGIKSTHYLDAINRFMNPYQINYGSSQLKNALDAIDLYNTNAGPYAGLRPTDYEYVRGVFMGYFRNRFDLAPP